MATIINPIATLRVPAAATATEPVAEVPVFQTLKISQNSAQAAKDRDIKAKQAAQLQRDAIQNMGDRNERYAAYGNPVTSKGMAKKGATKSIEEYRNTKKYERNKKSPYYIPRIPRSEMRVEFDRVANLESNYEGNNEHRTRVRDPSEKLNFIRRIWLTAKDVTHKQNYDDVIGRYQRILKIDPDNVKDSELDLFVAAPNRKRTWKNRLNPFTKRFATPELTNANKKAVRKGTKKQRNMGLNFKRQGLTPDAIRNYQLNAYNELMGIMLVLMEKARDKYSQTTLISRLGYRSRVFSDMFANYDMQGILHIDNLEEDYVRNIFGYNLDGRLYDVYTMFKKSNPSNPTTFVSFIKKHPLLITGMASIVYIIIMSVLFGTSDNSYYNCPPDTTIVTQGGGRYWTSRPSTKAYCQTVTGAMSLAPLVKSTTTAILTVGTMTAEQVLSMALAHGIPTAAILSYKIYTLQRGYKRKILLKSIFIDIHKVIFNEANSMKFDDAKEFVFVYNDILSKDEQELFDEYGPAIDSDATDQEMYEYITELLEARVTDLLNKGYEAAIDFTEELPKRDPITYDTTSRAEPHIETAVLDTLLRT